MYYKINKDSFPHIIDEMCLRINFLISSVLNKIVIGWWGVKLNGSIKTRGFIKIKRVPMSNITIGKGCSFISKPVFNLIGINRPCTLSTQAKGAIIEIGNNCGFSGTVVGAFEKITIGNNVKCGANSLITDADWHPEDFRSGKPAPVVIGNNVWLGVNTIVLKGVTIGENSLIGANSVVTRSIPANVIAVGNPCKVVKEIKHE